jgi:hypothetical protein
MVTSWSDQTQALPNRPATLELILQPPKSTNSFILDGNTIDVTSYWLDSLLMGNVTNSQAIGIDGKWISELVQPSSVFAEFFYRAMNRSKIGFPDAMDNLANSLSFALRTT